MIAIGSNRSIVVRSFLTRSGTAAALIAGATIACASSATAATRFASEVVSYTPGVNPAAGYTNPAVALGSPERFTGEGVFPSQVTPFNPAFGTDEIVSIGRGGSLTVRFDQPIVDNPANPFGVDLLIFGNSFFFDPVAFNPIANALDADGGTVEVSLDGVDWRVVPNALADGLFPTLGYLDASGPFPGAAGSVPSDFGTPVNPAFASSWQGQDLAGLLALYNGSGGGSGIDIGTTGLPQIQFVRVSVASTAAGNVEIDAFSVVVPAPGALGALALAGVVAVRRARRA